MLGHCSQVVEFLYLRRELKLSGPASKGYRATLSHVFSLAVMDLANKIISQMFSNLDMSTERSFKTTGMEPALCF